MAARSLGLGGHITYLPYLQVACHEIEHHLLSLVAAFPSPSFEATLSPFTHDGGRDAILVNAAGALPVAGSHVSVWLVEAYPHAPPIDFMPVTGSETTSPAYIDSSGAVTAPYLRLWRWIRTSLAWCSLSTSLSGCIISHRFRDSRERNAPSGTAGALTPARTRRRRSGRSETIRIAWSRSCR
jgi:hypothetical protein